MRKPIIGITPLFDEERDSIWMLPGYLDGITRAGGIPVILPMAKNREDILRFAVELDGFLFSGGQDVAPSIYGEEPLAFCGKPCPDKDRLELLLLREVIGLDKPALGVCRGLQFFNAALGGTLYQDLPQQLKLNSLLNHHQSPPYDQPAHAVSILPDTLLRAATRCEKIQVNSYHHQAVKSLAAALKPAAIAPDGLIEAAFHPGKRFLMGVQWHPEYMYRTDKASADLFTEFVYCCGQS